MGEAVAVLGAGGHAKVILSALRASGRQVAGVFDDDSAKQGRRILDVPVVGPLSDFFRSPSPALVGIGDNRARQRIAQRPAPWTTLVHPSAWVDPGVELGAGSVLFAGSVVQPGATIGQHAIVNTGATVDHDCVVADFAHVGPGCHMSGATSLREGAFLGTGSSTRQRITIGAWSVVGVGAAVVRDLPSGVTAAGVPARILKTHSISAPRRT